jgi:carboxypeptidase family protein/TonB-dependent receptor-like protein
VRKAVVMSGGALVLALALAPVPVGAATPNGGVLGWVEDSRGMPVSGAVISLFRGGAGGAGLVTLSDSAGRFFLPSLPAGSYTLRALRAGHVPAPMRQVVVLPNQDATFTVSLTPLSDAAARTSEAKASTAEEDAASETKWLLRHKRRSVLEARREGPAETEVDHPEEARLLASFLPDLDGTVEVMASPSVVGMGPGDDREPGSLSVLRLKGRIAESGRWSLGGVMAERESTTWRMAGEFAIEAMEGHELRAATGYGSRYVRAQEFAVEGLHDRGVGTLSLEDRWQITEGVTASVGGRFSYVGFLGDTNHFDPSASLEIQSADQTTFRGSVYARTVAPGGDILTLNSLASAPAMNFAVLDGTLRAERLTRYELAMDQQLGGTSVGAYTFYEGVRDQLVNAFEGAEETRALHIFNAGSVSTGGVGLTVGRCFGDSIRGSMSYAYGRSWREAPLPDANDEFAGFAHQDGNFHDLAARVETVFQGTDTRVVAYYRLNRMMPDVEERSHTALTNRRFDVQLSQGLPFLGAFTRADWNFLLAVRNVFYETSEGALMDEVAVINPPKRVLGGISVRF